MAWSVEGERLSDASETLVAYGPAHVVALAVIAAAAVVAVGVVRARGRSMARYACCMLAVGLLVNMIFEQCYMAATGRWSLAESLPLHLCDLSVFAAIAVLLLASRARVLAHATQSGGVPLAARLPVPTTHPANTGGQAASGTQGFPGPQFFTYFTAHGGIIVAVLVLMFGLRLRPRRGSGVRVWLLIHVVAVPVGVCDWLVGANYMYLCGPAEEASVLDYLGAWPWPYLLYLDLLVAACIALCYAPWLCIDRQCKT